MLGVEEVIEPNSQVKKVARSDPRWIGVVILGSRGWDLDTRGAPLRIGQAAGCDGIIQSSHLASTEEANRGLLIAIESQRRGQVRHGAIDQPALVLPCEAHPRTPFSKTMELVLDVSCLLKCLIMVNTKNRHVERRVENQAAHLRPEKA